MKYWIIVEDRHAGPFSAQQLVDTGLTPDTLVWYEGLPDWTRAANIPEIMQCLEQRSIAEAQARQELVEQARRDEERRLQAEEAERRAAMLQQQEEEARRQTLAVEPMAEENRHEETVVQPAYQPVQQAAPSASVAAQPTEPCPPAYIAWSIISTLLCCTIVGIPAIIFASMTKSAYYKGDLAKSKRYSELAHWFIIASIVLGAVSWPFQIAVMGMFQ